MRHRIKRRNPKRKKAHRKVARKRARKAAPRRRTRARKVARKTRRRAKRSSLGRKSRPIVYLSGGKVRRGARSKTFRKAHMRLANPHRRHKRRHNPMITTKIKSLLSPKNLINYLVIGVGAVGGSFLTNILATGMLPGNTDGKSFYSDSILKFMVKARPYMGIGTIVLGGFLAAKVKNKHMKNVALGVAVYGGYDLAASLIDMLMAKPADATKVAGMNMSMFGANVDGRSNRIVNNVRGMDMSMFGGNVSSVRNRVVGGNVSSVANRVVGSNTIVGEAGYQSDDLADMFQM